MLKHTKYSHLEAITLDEIDLDRVDTIIVRTTYFQSESVSITKLSSKDMMIEPGQGYNATHEAFLGAVQDICDQTTYPNESSMLQEIVRWRDNDHVWHIHTGPVERHAALGDKVMFRSWNQSPQDVGHIVRIYIDDINKMPYAEIAFAKHNVCGALSQLQYVDNPDIDVVS